MGGLTMRLSRTMSQSSRRFLRDVAASMLATGVASVAFSHLAHEGGHHPAATRVAGKFDERLTWRTEDVPTRQTTTYDTLAMFALPLAAETSWSEAPVFADAIAAPADPAKSDIARPEPVRASHARLAAVPARAPVGDSTDRPARLAQAALPPVRPAAIAIVPAAGPAATPDAGPRPIRLLGWTVPGSDLIPSGPEALRQVASLGGKVASLGGSIVETVGLR